MATWRIQGSRERGGEPSLLAGGLPPGAVTVKHAIRVQAGRAAGAPLALDDVAPDDVLEIELQDGLRLWARADDFRADYAGDSARGADDDDVVVVPPALGPANARRGESRTAADRGPAWTLAIKALRVLGVRVEGRIGRLAATLVERRLQPGPGLYACSETAAARLQPLRRLPDGPRTLVFLHGTASSTAGSFGALWDGGGPAPALFRHYGGRVLGFQHETLTKSPVENALALVEALRAHVPAGGEVHLVSHSRGGLVGELVARGMRAGAHPFTPDDLALFDGEDRTRDRAALAELGKALAGARLQVTRFVRVACPARGTTLADGRLDRYFSVLVNLASWIPALRASAVFDGLTGLLGAVLKQRTDPRELPGLEAMMPGSPLVQLLNRPGVVTGADLHVLGGDLEGEGLFGRLKTLVTDAYYREDHDLVVNTPSMLGGAERATPIRYWVDQGADVTHFHYFGREDTSSRLASALLGDSTRFRTLEATPSTVTMADYRARATGPRPAVVVVPGIMGSELALGKRRVWVDLFALAGGGLARLHAGAAGVEATGLVADSYAAFCRHLANSHAVEPFPYDWRLGIAPAAERLTATIDRLAGDAETADQPVRIVAHSMGGLVVRAMLATRKGAAAWARAARHPGSRVVMLGTPNGGSHAIAALLVGRDALLRKLALVDLEHDHAGLLETIAAFDGVLDLLPDAASGLDLFDRTTWEAIFAADVPQDRGIFGGGGAASSTSAGFRWTPPDAARLKSARARRTALREAMPAAGRLIYVAGVAEETACDLVVDPQAPAGRRVRVLATTDGDGRVPWSTGIPAGAATYYLDAAHGDLANTARAFPALLDLLVSGHTAKLPMTPPRRRGAREVFELRTPAPEMLPDEADLLATAVGGSRPRSHREREGEDLHVQVVHGNLRFAASPVLIGHYLDDVIVGAEAYLDRQLHGRLAELQRMELYVGALPTSVAVLNETGGPVRPHPGAIVAGLGRVGELTPGRLTAALEHAFTTYGAESMARIRRSRQATGAPPAEGATTLAVTSVLVGSGEGGVALADSVRAIVRAAANANRRLAVTARGDGTTGQPGVAVRIGRVDIVELYEDRAIEAAHALRGLARAGASEGLVTADLLERGRGGLHRPRFDTSPAWWQRIRVTTTDPSGGLQFEALTHLSRAHATLQPTQRRVVEGFVTEAQSTTASAPGLGSTLFELLIPNEFKPYAPDRQRLVLVLDAASAALPWELLEDKYDKGARPLAVESGMIRQLIVDGGRPGPLRAAGPTALVVGNPIVADERFPSLPGAEAEAVEVTTLLTSRGFAVTPLLGSDASPMAVIGALHDRPWRIVHLAAHGVFEFVPEPGEPPVSGLVLDGGIYLTAAEARSMRHVPDVVFINCCHLGRTSGDVRPYAFHRLAANLATEFIAMGARAVVAAGWAVSDAAASTFARAFYDRLFDGHPYGEAVAWAREATFEAHGDTNTWGAYQCYGDPSFSLGPPKTAETVTVPVAASEFAFELARLRDSAKDADAAGQAALRPKLAELVRTCAEGWLESADVLIALAAAHGELGDFDSAVMYYERAFRDRRAAAPLQAVEQLVNMMVRSARARMDQREARGRVVAQLRAAERLLNRLDALGETPERAGLRGSLEKCWATAGGRGDKSLARMRAAYGRTVTLAESADASERARGLSNQIAAQIAQGWGMKADSRRRAAIRQDLDELDRLGQRLREDSTDVFDRVAAVDAQLLRALMAGTLTPAVCDQVADGYRALATLGLSVRQRDSILAQLAFFVRMAQERLPKARAAALVERLLSLRAVLKPEG
jgi:hypothetical protein